MVQRYVRYNSHELTIHVNFMVKCVCVGFGSNSFLTKMQPFLMDGHYKMDVISCMGYPRLDEVVPVMLCMVCYAMTKAPT